MNLKTNQSRKASGPPQQPRQAVASIPSSDRGSLRRPESACTLKRGYTPRIDETHFRAEISALFQTRH